MMNLGHAYPKKQYTTPIAALKQKGREKNQ